MDRGRPGLPPTRGLARNHLGLSFATRDPVLPGEKPDARRAGQTRPGWTGFMVQQAEMLGEFKDEKC